MNNDLFLMERVHGGRGVIKPKNFHVGFVRSVFTFDSRADWPARYDPHALSKRAPQLGYTLGYILRLTLRLTLRFTLAMSLTYTLAMSLTYTLALTLALSLTYVLKLALTYTLRHAGVHAEAHVGVLWWGGYHPLAWTD